MDNLIFDSHAHYSDERFEPDRDTLLMGMKERGVGNIVEVGATIESTKDVIALSKQYDFVYASVGIHPEDVGNLTEEHMEWLKSLAKEDKVVAIGEIGLDYYYETSDRETQKKWFIRQLQVAAETEMPVIIHSRDAAKDTLEIMNAYCDYQQGGVIHCFSYSWEMATEYIKKGFFIGIGGVVTFKNSKKLKEVVKNAPLEQIILETDCPYLTPVPHRGHRNDSGYLSYVADTIAEIKNVPVDEVIRVTRENAMKLYRL